MASKFERVELAAYAAAFLGGTILFVGVFGLLLIKMVTINPEDFLKHFSPRETIWRLAHAVLGCGILISFVFWGIGGILLGISEIGKKLESLESRFSKQENRLQIDTTPIFQNKCLSWGAALGGGEKFYAGCGKPVGATLKAFISNLNQRSEV